MLVLFAAALLPAGAQAFKTHGLFSGGSNVATPDQGTGTPYPSTLNVSGLDGRVESVTVTFFVTHANPDDLDVLLVGPTGKKIVLMSDAGGTADLNNKQLRFTDGKPAIPDSSAASGVEVAPTNYGAGDPFPAPVPAGTPSSTLAGAFKGINPNGTWSLYVVDDSPGGGTGQVGGWRLTIGTQLTVVHSASTVIPAQGSASPYPSTISVPKLAGKLTRVEATLNGYSHTQPNDVDVLLVSPGGQKVRLMSDAGGTDAVSNKDLRFTDDAAGQLPNETGISSGSWRPSNYGVGDDNFPSPAPGDPYGTAMADFNGQRGAGTWKLFVNDDGAGDGGSIQQWSLTLVTDDQPPQIGNIADQVVNEGQIRDVAVSGSDADGDPLTWTLPGNAFGLGSLVNSTATSTTVRLAPQAGDAGGYNVEVDATDGDFTALRTFHVTVNDKTPPSTTALASPAPNPAGWNKGSVGVTLNATDLSASVQSITYGASGAQSLPATTVNGSSVVVPQITQEGITTLAFHATDTKGNVEPDKTLTIRIDKTKPTFARHVAVGLREAATLGNGDTLPATAIDWHAVDSGSGLDHYQLRRSVDGGAFNGVSLNTPLSESASTQLTPGTNVQFKVNAFDVAENQGNPDLTPVEAVGLIQDTNPDVDYTGTWSGEAGGPASGGARHFATVAGARATFGFTGTSVSLVTSRGPDRGRAEVRVDGVLEEIIEGFNPTQTDRFVAFTKNGLTDGSHSIEVTVLGTKSAASTGTRVDVDGFGVLDPS